MSENINEARRRLEAVKQVLPDSGTRSVQENIWFALALLALDQAEQANTGTRKAGK
jgi:hypothetical protein